MMRHTTTETHKQMIDLIDAIRRSPSLSPGVRHRAQRLSKMIDGMGTADGAICIEDLHDYAEGSICEHGFQPATPTRDEYPPEWDVDHAVSEMACDVIENHTIDDILIDVIPAAVKEHIDAMVINKFSEEDDNESMA